MANLPLFSEKIAGLDTPGGSLAEWVPKRWPTAPDWVPVIQHFLGSDSARELGNFIGERIAAGATIYPLEPFRALDLTPLAKVRVVILGQDPYHGPGQAQGLAFSVAAGVPLPPSLRNIYKEIARDKLAQPGAFSPTGAVRTPLAPTSGQSVNGSLVRWASQGVLLLNTCLSVEKDRPASHSKKGWEVLTDNIIEAVWASPRPVVFMLWGAHAQARQALMVSNGASSAGRHLVLTANHPSPLSALRAPKPFIGCGHFGQANAFLTAHNGVGIDW
jgi:uracil-DNA glycosylase